ncbi:MAG: HAMP domain-containing histidine kinase [Variovorax sp.]|nr:HAMP domain-containing histidine kinase [Variovorax sp.]
MTPLPSIRKGLSRVVLQVSLAWSLAVFGVVWFTVLQQLDKVLDGTLQESAEILYGLLKVNQDRWPQGAVADRRSLPAPPHDENMVWQLVAADRTVIWRSHRAPDEPLSPKHGGRAFDESARWHVFGMPFDDEGTMLYVGQADADRLRAQAEAALVTAFGALMVGVACAVWLRRRVSKELDPLVDLSRQVALYDPLVLDRPLPAATREELRPLREAVVKLGERLAQNIASERAFSANAAHALRTPLAGLGMQLAVAQRESPGPVQARIQRARDAADRLGRVVVALLSLFRSGGQIAPQPIRLAALVRDLPVHGLRVHIEEGEDMTVQADPDLLAAALINLLDNSVRYGASRVVCSFRRDAGSGMAVIRLVDDGPGVDASARARIEALLAGRRDEASTGLGLILADRVARAHGGWLRLVDAGQGFGIEIALASR